MLRHILDEMDFLTENCSDIDVRDLMEDKVLSRACLKSLEIIEEASRNISEDLRVAHREVPWRQDGRLEK